MSFFPDFDNVTKLAYCLECGGTGVRGGNLSGKKKCKVCKGSGNRTVLYENKGTVLDAINLHAVKDPNEPEPR